jgi:hypothetical protein
MSGPSDFDPWTATLDEAVAAHEPWKRARGGDGPGGPIYQWAAAKAIEAEREAADSGDGFAVLACINQCVTHDLVAPEWLAYAFNRHYHRVLTCKVGSWDEAFGKPYPGRHLEKLRIRREKGVRVWLRIRELRQSESRPPIDDALFETVGAELGIGKTLCAELYYGFAGRMTSAKSE